MYPDNSAHIARVAEEIRSPSAATALGTAALRALPLVQERRGTALRNTEDVARRLTMSAIDLFDAHGFDDVTVNQIAAAAGVAKRTFFRYFPSKEDVVLDIWNQTSDDLVRLIDETPGSDTFEVLASACITWIGEFEELHVRLAEISERSRTLTAAGAVQNSAWESKIADAVRRRFPALSTDEAALAGVVVMGCFRLGRKRMKTSGTSYPESVGWIFSALGRMRHPH